MATRRKFLQIGSAAGAGLFLYYRNGLPRVFAAIPGGTLDPDVVPKFVTPMLIPPVMPRAGTIKRQGGKNVDYYEISMKQITQQILPAGLPATTVWGYGAVAGAEQPRPAPPQRALAHDRGAGGTGRSGSSGSTSSWTRTGNYLPHLLPVDPTLHWANPPGGTAGPRHAARRSRETPGPYTGPVPIVTHVHGAVGRRRRERRLRGGVVPAGREQHPGGLRHGRHLVRLLRRQGRGDATASTWGPGFATFQYPNDNRASTIWYHDHALGMTRLNVYAGPAGFYLVRGGPAGDDAVLDSRTGLPAVAARPGAAGERQVPAQQALPRDPDRDPGPRRSTRTGRSSTRTRGSSSTGSSARLHPGRASSRRSGIPSSSAT